MALQYVGGTTGTGTSNGYTVSLSGTLTGGIGSSPDPGDIVIVVSAFGYTASSAPNVTGNNNGAYTGFQTAVHVNDSWDTEFRTFYKVMGATVDTSLTITRATSTAYGGATIVQVWRGQHATNPIDQNYAYTTILNASRAVPANATPSCDAPVVISFGAGTTGSGGSAFTIPAQLTGGGQTVKADGTTSDISVWTGWVAGTNGVTQVVNAPTGGVTSTSSSGAAHTIVLAPDNPNRDLYWVGGTGTWDTTSITNWSLSSGGSAMTTGNLPPSQYDNLFFDSNSGGTYTVTQTGAIGSKDLTVSAGAVTFATGTTPTLSIAGNLSLTAGTTTWNSTGAITFSGTTQTVNTNGTTISASATVPSGTLQLLSNLTLPTTATFTLTAGTLDLNDYTLSTGLFSSSNSNTRSIAFGTTGQIELTSATASTIWTTATPTNFIYTGTSKVSVTGSGATTKTINTGTMIEEQALNWYLQATEGTVTFTANNAVKDLTINGAFTLSNIAISIYGNYIYTTATSVAAGTNAWTFAATTGTQTLTSNVVTYDFPMTKTGDGTLQLTSNLTLPTTATFTLTAGTLDLNGYTLSTGLFSSSNINTRSIAFGTTGQIELTSTTTSTIWTTTTPTNFTYTGTSKVVTTGGGATTKTIDTGSMTEAQALNWYLQATAGTVVFTASNAAKDLTINGAFTLGNRAITIYGNYTYTAGTVNSGTSAWTFAATSGTQILTNNGLTLDFPIAKTGDGTLQLTENLTLPTTSTFTLTAGTLDLNDYTLSTGLFSSSNSNTRSIAFGTTGQIELTNSAVATIWNTATLTNWSTTGTSKVSVTGSGSTTKTINTGAMSEEQALNWEVTPIGGIITFTAGNAVKNLVLNIFGITFTNVAITIYGNCTFLTEGSAAPGSNAWTFAATSGIQTLSSAGNTLDFPIVKTGASTLQLSDQLTLGSTRTLTLSDGTLDLNNIQFNNNLTLSSTTVSITNPYGGALTTSGSITQTSGTFTLQYPVTTDTFTLTAGTLDLNDYTLSTTTFSSSNSNTRSIAFGTTGQIELTSSTTETIWNTATLTNWSTTGTSKIVTTGGGITTTKTINTGTMTEAQALNWYLQNTAGTVAFTANNAVKDLTINGAFTLSNIAISIYGNYTYTTATAITAGANAWTFGATSGTQTLTSNGVTQRILIVKTGDGTLQLTENLTLLTTGTFTLTAGTLDLNDYTLSTGLFSSSNSNVRSIAFGTTGQIELTSTTTSTIWTTTTPTNFTYTGTSKIVTTSSGSSITRTINTGAMTEAQALNWYLQNTLGAVTFTANDAVKDLTINGTFALRNIAISIYGNYTYTAGTVDSGTNAWTFAATSGTQTIDGGGYTHNLPMVKTVGSTLQLSSSLTLGSTRTFTLNDSILDFNGYTLTAATGLTTTGGSIGGNGILNGPLTHTSGTVTLLSNLTISSTYTYTLTAGTLDLNDYTLSTGLFSSSNSNTRSIAFGTTGQIELTSATTSTIWTTATLTNWSTTGTSKVLVTGGTGATKTINTGTMTEAQALNWDLQATAGAVAFTASNAVKDLTINGAFTLSNIAITIYGNYTYTTATALTAGTNAWTFGATSGTQTINGGGYTHDFPMTKTGAGILQLTDSLLLGSTKALTLTTGTLDLNNLAFYNNLNLNGGSYINPVIVDNTWTVGGITWPSGTHTLDYNITCINTYGYVLTSGTLDLNNYTLSTATFSSSNSNTRSIAFGTTGQINLTSTTTATIWNTATLTNWSTTGTSKVVVIGSGNTTILTINTGTMTEEQALNWDLQATSFATVTFTANNAVKNLAITGNFTLSNIAISIYGNYTYVEEAGAATVTLDGTWTFGATSVDTTQILDSGGKRHEFNFVKQGEGTLQLASNLDLGNNNLTLSAGTFDLNNYTFDGTTNNRINVPVGSTGKIGNGTLGYTINQDGGTLTLIGNLTVLNFYYLNAGTLDLNNYQLTVGTFSTSAGGARTLAFGTTGELILRTSWNSATPTNFTYTGTSKIVVNQNYNYSPNTGTMTEAQAMNWYVELPTGGSLNFTAGNAVKNLIINSTGTGYMANSAITIYGDYTHISGDVPDPGANAWTFAATSGTQTLSSNGLTHDFPMTKTGAGTLQLSSSLTLGATRTFTLTAGTLDLNDYTLSTGLFSSSLIGTRSIAFGTSGQINLIGTSTATVWQSATSTGFSHTGTSKVVVKSVSSVTKTISPGTMNEAQALNWHLESNTAGGTLAFSSGHTINDLTINGEFTLLNRNITIYGNYTYTAGTVNSGTNAWTFGATSGTQTLTSNGLTHDFPMTKTGAGTLQLLGELTLGSSRSFTLTAGTLDLNNIQFYNDLVLDGGSYINPLLVNNTWTVGSISQATGTHTLDYNITCINTSGYTLTAGTLDLNDYTLSTGSFSSSNSNVRSIAFGTTGQINLTSTTAATIWSTPISLNFTYTGTSKVVVTGAYATTKTIDTGSMGESKALNWYIQATDGIIDNLRTAKDLVLNGNFTLSNSTRFVYGNYTYISGTLTGGALGEWEFGATSGTQTINGGGYTHDFPMNKTGAGTLQLSSSLTLGATKKFTLTTGTLDLNDYTLNTGLFSSSNTNTRSIAFGTNGQINLIGTSTLTIWDTATPTNFSYTGTSKVLVTGGTAATKTISTGAMTEEQALNWDLQAPDGIIVGLEVAKDLVLNGTFELPNAARTIYGDYLISSDSATAISGSLSTTFNKSSGSQVFQTTAVNQTPPNISGCQYFNNSWLKVPYNANQALTNVNFTIEAWIYPKAGSILMGIMAPWQIGGAWRFNINSSNYLQFVWTNVASSTSTLQLDGSSVMVKMNQWNHVAVVRNGSTLKLYVNGTADATSYNIGTTSILYYQNSGKDIYIGAGEDAGDPFNGYIGDVRIVKGTAVYTANFTPPSLASLATSGSASAAAYPSTTGVNTTFASTSTVLLTCLSTTTPVVDFSTTANSITAKAAAAGSNTAPSVTNFSANYIIGFPIIKTGNGILQLNSIIELYSSRTFTLTDGTIDLNDYTLSTGLFATGAGTKNIAGDGAIIISGSGATAWNNAEPTNFTITQGTNPITISMTSASAKTFVGGSSDYSGAVIDQGGAGALTVTGDNTFGNITNSYGATGATSIIFTAGTTTTFNDWNASGTAGKLLTIESTTTSPYTFYKSSGTVSATYLSISYCTITGEATWNAGANSIDSGNNSISPGWIFASTPPASANIGAPFLVFFV